METQKSKALVEIKDLAKVFQRRGKEPLEALSGVSLEIPHQQLTAVVGHNGAGKTTLFRSLLGLSPPSHGVVLWQGNRICSADRARIGYIPEHSPRDLPLTVREALYFHACKRGVRQPKLVLSQILKQVSLLSQEHIPIPNLSKGNKRRLQWALAMVHDPDLYVFDEPLSGLDALGRRDFVNWVKQALSKGKTFVWATHNWQALEGIAHRILVLGRGKALRTLDFASDNGDRSYQVCLSGIGYNSLLRFQKDNKLASYDGIRQEGALFRLMFDNYSNALDWLQKSIKEGITVESFAGQSRVTTEVVDQWILEGAS